MADLAVKHASAAKRTGRLLGYGRKTYGGSPDYTAGQKLDIDEVIDRKSVV